MRSLSLAACLVALALPSGALAQTPGDDQYTDPFGGSQDEGSAGQPEDDGDEAPPPAATPAPAAPETSAPSAEPAEAGPAQATEQLPYTGADAGLLALGGITLVVGGVTLRLRLRQRRPERQRRLGRRVRVPAWSATARTRTSTAAG